MTKMTTDNTVLPIVSAVSEGNDKLLSVRNICGDCIVFDVADEGRIIAVRSTKGVVRKGESFYGHITEQTRAHLRSYLLEYDPRPMIIDTDRGIAIVISSFMPSASLAVAIIPHVQRRTLIRFLKKKDVENEFEWEEDLRPSGKCRLSAALREVENDLDVLLEQIYSCFGNSDAKLIDMSIAEYLAERIQVISRFIGCTSKFVEPYFFNGFENFDFSLFDVFLLISSLMCLEIPNNCGVDIRFDISDGGARIIMHTVFGDQYTETSQEIAYLESLSGRKRMGFEYSKDQEGILCVKFSPINRDWSSLGLKTKISFIEKSGSDLEKA